MEKLIVEIIGIIKEEDYQKIKKEMNKRDDCFYEHELKLFNAILMQLNFKHEIEN